CGKPMCEHCRRDMLGTIYCDEHVPAPASTTATPGFTPPAPPPPPRVYADVSPGLALFLGFIPGVGAIYNGQYAKGILHAVIWGVLMSIGESRNLHSAQPLMIITMLAFWAYMALEAYHAARKRRNGEPVDEYSSIVDLRAGRDLPLVAIGLIVFGAI